MAIYDLQSPTGGLVPVIFLDTYLPENDPEDRGITSVLYGGDERYRLKQEMVLGIGGTRMLNLLKFRINKYHMNEGHSNNFNLLNGHYQSFKSRKRFPAVAVIFARSVTSKIFR
jgi:glycogen phosphorylase